METRVEAGGGAGGRAPAGVGEFEGV